MDIIRKLLKAVLMKGIFRFQLYRPKDETGLDAYIEDTQTIVVLFFRK